jgi:hypothetical protein
MTELFGKRARERSNNRILFGIHYIERVQIGS